MRKVSKKLKEDLGEYLAKELSEENEARIKDLKAAQAKARETGEEKRVEVVQYSGLIGQTLELAGKVFPGYEAVKKRVLPSPSVPPNILAAAKNETSGGADNLTDIYNDYVSKKDPDQDSFLGVLDNCPNVYNPDQADSDHNGVGDACETASASTTTESVLGDNNLGNSGAGSEATNTEDFDNASTTAGTANDLRGDASSASSTAVDSGSETNNEAVEASTPDPITASGTEVEIIELPE